MSFRSKTLRGGVEVLGEAPVVILSRPQMAENVGTAARAMLNFGVYELRLVAPAFGWPNAKALMAASGANEVLNRMEIFQDLPSALHDIQTLYATTARGRDLTKPVLEAEAAAQAAHQSIADGRRVAYLFGPERTGLENDEVALADAILTIPVNPYFPSLNLAQAVLLASYEWHRQRPDRPLVPSDDKTLPASKADVHRLHEALMVELDEVDFFKTAERRRTFALTIETMLERRSFTTSEIHLFRGIVKELVTGRRRREGAA
ncbi:MAG TPA: TrmH family RNA methyltransferase [Geminicoccus sp.]|jgi:tRNA/rRNA methyltransferase|uniref:RNA methyltransferase n=1 Tax=Geminicoccus sp. TaxID=2024832 RepID=UPI002E367248|nr:TrmH family RNA methyltransferase [Geminicoccus sp.]HEX2526777.1 TrmH family RNA methyltransferase [Geminicoccus sp.]